MKICAGGICIDLILKFESEFNNLSLFKTNNNCLFKIETIDNLDFNIIELISSNKYFKKYKTNIGLLQINYFNNKEVGKVLFKETNVYLCLTVNSFNVEYMLAQYAFAYLINNYTNNMFIHSSSVLLNENGILLLAKSGVGKSTLRGELEDVGGICINDDKNIISFEDDGIYILESPFAGKHFICNKIKAKLNTLVFVKRGINNKIVKLDKNEAIMPILSQILLPSKKNKKVWNLNLDKLLNLNLIEYYCNISKETGNILKQFLEENHEIKR